MAGYIGISMSVNAAEAHNEGRKPVSCITKGDIQKYGVKESVTLFRWYVKNFCRTCEWHHTSPKYNETHFYDIEECRITFKKQNIEQLKNAYKNQKKPKPVNNDECPYYARVEYSISTYSGSRKYLEGYAIIHKCWAYLKDDYKKAIIRKKIDGMHFHISERFQSRPGGLPEDVADSIMKKINTSSKK